MIVLTTKPSWNVSRGVAPVRNASTKWRIIASWPWAYGSSGTGKTQPVSASAFSAR